MLFPFAITLLICLSCKDISYPKIEITSESIGGIGEVLLSYGKHVKTNSTILETKLNISDTRSYILKNDKKLEVLLSYFGSTLTFEGEYNSNQLWSTLFNEYYEHEDNRWSSFVVDDKIEKWIESSVTFNQVDFQAKNISLDKIYQNIVDSYYLICENNVENELDNFVPGDNLVDKSNIVSSYDDVIDKVSNKGEKSLQKNMENVDESSEEITLPTISSHRQLLSKSKFEELPPNSKIETVDSGDSFVKRSVHVCDKHPYFTISLLKTYSFPNVTKHQSRLQRDNDWGDEGSNDDAVEAETFFIISAFESLHSNLTMLFNISSDHSLPVFYKEIAPIIYNVYNGVGKLNNKIGNNHIDNNEKIAGNDQSSTSLQKYQSNYRLYSYPLPEINYNNRIYSQRGYIGSIMILLYILISTAKAVTVFTEIHESKMKNLFYLSGINFVEYFVTNIFFDIILLLFGFFSVYFGILVGGSPVDKYFLSFYDSSFGFIFIVLNIMFACSIVISSYFYTLNSLSVLSNQLFLLLTSIFCGIFMKLYFDKHTELSALAAIVRIICPSYNYSLAIFELFKWNTVNLMIIGEVHILGKEMQLILKNIMDSMVIMGIQCVYYLILIIIFEKYQLKIKQNTQYVKRIVYITLYSLWKILPDINEVFRISYFDNYSSKKNQIASGSRRPVSNSGLVFDMLQQNRTEIGMFPLLSLRKTNTQIEHSSKLNRSYNSFDSPNNCNSAVQSHTNVAEDHFVLSHDEVSTQKKLIIKMQNEKTNNVEMEKSSGKSPFAGFTMNRKVRSNSFDSNVSQISFGSSMQWIVDEDNEDDSFLEHDKNFQWDEEFADKNERESECESGKHVSRYSLNRQGFRLKNMYVEYSNNNHKLSLRNVNISIRPNDRIALMGINGSGKSTLFKTLTFIENVPIFGDITFDGRSVIDSYYDMCENNFVSFVPQEMKYLNYLTVYDVFYIFHKLKFRSESRGRFSADLADFTRSSRSLLSDRYTHYPISLLSGGNKKRLFLGVAALVDPRLLLLDECTSGVDPIAAENIIAFLSRFYSPENDNAMEIGDTVNRSLLFASHRIDECINICKQVVILNAGQVVFNGSIDTFFHISNAFYQIDITLHAEPTANSKSPNNAMMGTSPTVSTTSEIQDSNNGVEDIFTQNKKHFDIILRIKHDDMDPLPAMQRSHLDAAKSDNYQGQMFVGNGIERYIIYSPLLLRITCNKAKLPLSKVLMLLQTMKTEGDIASFAIREMNMEEVLSNIIDTIND